MPNFSLTNTLICTVLGAAALLPAPSAASDLPNESPQALAPGLAFTDALPAGLRPDAFAATLGAEAGALTALRVVHTDCASHPCVALVLHNGTKKGKAATDALVNEFIGRLDGQAAGYLMSTHAVTPEKRGETLTSLAFYTADASDDDAVAFVTRQQTVVQAYLATHSR